MQLVTSEPAGGAKNAQNLEICETPAYSVGRNGGGKRIKSVIRVGTGETTTLNGVEAEETAPRPSEFDSQTMPGAQGGGVANLCSATIKQTWENQTSTWIESQTSSWIENQTFGNDVTTETRDTTTLSVEAKENDKNSPEIKAPIDETDILSRMSCKGERTSDESYYSDDDSFITIESGTDSDDTVHYSDTTSDSAIGLESFCINPFFT